MPRGSITEFEWKDGETRSFRIKYRTADGRQKTETLPTRRRAERVLARRLAAIADQTYEEPSRVTFAEFTPRWLDGYVALRLRPSTNDAYRRIARLHLLPAFGACRLSAITRHQLNDFVVDRRRAGLAPAAVNHIMGALRSLFREALGWGVIARNPAAGLRSLPEPKKERPVLSPEQLRRVLGYADPRDWLLIATAAGTGLRPGELLALRWRDIDASAHQLTVRRACWRGRIGEPKTKQGRRTVNLMPFVSQALAERSVHHRGEELVFPGAQGQLRVQISREERERFRRALSDAGCPRLRFYDLRHTFASHLILAGMHPKYIQEQMGHSSIIVTLDRYGHLIPSAYAGAGEKVQKALFGVGAVSITAPHAAAVSSSTERRGRHSVNREGEDRSPYRSPS